MKTRHTAETGQTYFQHFLFAMSVGFIMLISSCFFIIHGAVPWVAIPWRFNLNSMALWLFDKNQALEDKKSLEAKTTKTG
jgi:hypothetical protein